jgi:Raf kinase inhibitor-like YbhB/YbcL family protein
VFLSACKIEIKVPAQGRVTTESKSFTCEANQICSIDVSNTLFDEVFVAESNTAGVSYVEWVRRSRGLCGGSSEPCHLFTSGFGGNAALMALLGNEEEIFYLDPVFFSITSPSFNYSDEIPAKFTCDSLDYSPELAWSGVPSKTRSLALVVDDPDAPQQTPWVHWLIYNLPVDSQGVQESGSSVGFPDEALMGINDFGQVGYNGPCPPNGTHRYLFKLYALDIILPDLGQPDKSELESAMDGHIIGEAVLMGTYSYP